MLSSGGEALRTAAAIAYVCAHLVELSDLLGDDGTDEGTPLRRFLSALRSSSPLDDTRTIDELLDRLHTEIQAAGDTLGVYGSVEFRAVRPTGLDPLEIVYRCPLRRCTGRPAAQVTEAEPYCLVSPERAMVRDRLV